MTSKMHSELTMGQMASASGGTPPPVALANPAYAAALGVALALDATGAASFYLNWYKNVKCGQGVGKAALNAGKSACIAGLED